MAEQFCKAIVYWIGNVENICNTGSCEMVNGWNTTLLVSIVKSRNDSKETHKGFMSWCHTWYFTKIRYKKADYIFCSCSGMRNICIVVRIFIYISSRIHEKFNKRYGSRLSKEYQIILTCFCLNLKELKESRDIVKNHRYIIQICFCRKQFYIFNSSFLINLTRILKWKWRLIPYIANTFYLLNNKMQRICDKIGLWSWYWPSCTTTGQPRHCQEIHQIAISVGGGKT